MLVLNDFNTSVSKALSEIDPKWRDYDGLVVCGTHAPHDVEYMIDCIKHARDTKKPALLICFGYQLGCIEYFRDEHGIYDATSEEFSDIGTFVVRKRPELKVGLHDGESWWSNYEADAWPVPGNFIAVPFHPEYQSSKDKPHPLLVQFLKLCVGK